MNVNISIGSTSDYPRVTNDAIDLIDERVRYILSKLEESMKAQGATEEEIRAAIISKILELQRQYD